MARPVESSNKTIHVLFVAAEADPIIKVGGLGDVTGSLPLALSRLTPHQAMGSQLDIRLAIPFHAAIRARIAADPSIPEPKLVASFDVKSSTGPIAAQAYQTRVGDLPVYLIDGAPIPKDASVYSLDTRKDGDKYIFFSLAVLELARSLDWKIDILHANDWHTAISVYALALWRTKDPFFAKTHSILTVHNLPFMGAGTEQSLAYFDIPPLVDNRLPPWGAYQPLPMGLSAADFITTVSPTYSREIMTSEFGCGLEDFLQLRAGSISGILNGLDETAWDPATDPALATNFTDETPGKRLANKQALLSEFSLPPNLDLPLLIFIGRMDQQKGVDLAIKALGEISGLPWQAILLGTGDPVLEKAAQELEAEYPYRVRAAIRFDAQLSRRMYAGGEMLLMPSRYEPCGLAQMIAMRFGCLPVARSTGGLRDTVKDNQTPETSTGFLFEEATPEAMAATLRRAIAAYGDQESWQARQHYGMQQNFSWQRSAEAYAQIYFRLQSP